MVKRISHFLNIKKVRSSAWLMTLLVFLITGYIVYANNRSDTLIANQKKEAYQNLPTNTPIPTGIVKAAHVDSDPIITCNIHANCGGGSKQLKTSVCNSMTCCNFNPRCGGSQFVTKTACNTLYCCLLKEGGKLLASKSDCDNYYTNTNTNTINNYTVPTNVGWDGKIDCYYSRGTYNFNFGRITPAECTEKSNKYWADLNANITKVTPANTAGPTSEQIASCIADVTVTFNSLMGGCYIKFEGSAADACSKAYQSQATSYRISCQQTGTHATINVPVTYQPTPTPLKVPIGYP